MTLSFITRKNQLSVSSVLRQRLKLKMIPLGNGPLDNRVKGQPSAKQGHLLYSELSCQKYHEWGMSNSFCIIII